MNKNMEDQHFRSYLKMKVFHIVQRLMSSYRTHLFPTSARGGRRLTLPLFISRPCWLTASRAACHSFGNLSATHSLMRRTFSGSILVRMPTSFCGDSIRYIRSSSENNVRATFTAYLLTWQQVSNRRFCPSYITDLTELIGVVLLLEPGVTGLIDQGCQCPIPRI